ncbi:hypothetical protein Dehly_0524 [Dehalogenimonas lykanthroporepellens BL-DC-9]|nr:hypothetical protein Dehly_0524 [Dehalogenimonas lykanthroporepellens BL-DC-9]
MSDKFSEKAWLEAFQPIHSRADEIIDEVAQAIERQDETATTVMLEKAVTELTALVGQLKDLPRAPEKQQRNIAGRFQKAYKVFLEGCGYGIAYFQKPSPWNRSVWWLTNDVATEKIRDANSYYCYCYPEKPGKRKPAVPDPTEE